MKRSTVFVPLLWFFFGIMAPGVRAETIIAQVSYVIDGDSFKVALTDGRKAEVRLQGIDAPEYRQPWGRQSRESLERVLDERAVRLEWNKKDRYGRLLAQAWVQPPDCERCGRTLEAGLYQLTNGSAWYFRRYAKELSDERQGQYDWAETEAKARRAGLWADPGAIAPWQWRRDHPRGKRTQPESATIAR